MDDIYFPFALVDNHLGFDQFPGQPDIDIYFNSDFQNIFYYNTDGQVPQNMSDFVSVALHELIHGLGFQSSARNDNGTLRYRFDSQTPAGELPYTYDRFVVNGSSTTLLSLPSSGGGLSAFLQNNNLFFNGTESVTANGGSNVRISAPATFSGASISHLDQDTWENPTSGNALMVPERPRGTAIHNPGPVGIGILNDIGWEALLFVGIEDAVTIRNGLVYPYQQPATTLDVGSSYSYQVEFYDDLPSNYIVSRSWKLEVIHSYGKYLLHSSPNAYDWQFTLADLPPNYHWSRNIHGQVNAIITMEAVEDDGHRLWDELPIKINYRPDKPEVILKNSPNGGIRHFGCSSVEVSFFAAGATSYAVFYKKTTDLNFIAVSVPDGWYSYTFTGLDESSAYVFRVNAINSAGGMVSDDVTRRSCTAQILPRSPVAFIDMFNNFINQTAAIPLITAFPNPCIFSVQFSIASTVGARIQRIEMINTTNPAYGQIINVNPSAQQVLVNMSNLPGGFYSAKVTDTNNYEVTLLILKLF